MKRIAALCCLVVLILTSEVPLVSAASGPSSREGAAMAYDVVHQEEVLFGGKGSSGLLGDTWVGTTPGRSGLKWKRLQPETSPPARQYAAMAYDAGRSQVMLFGGLGASGPLGDTWTWDGETWQQRTSQLSPSPRFGASIAYDAARNNVVLFGGRAQVDANTVTDMNDTWIWDGSSWALVATTGPQPRHFGAMAYDARRGQAVLFGGIHDSGACSGCLLGDTWTFDGVIWAQRLFPTPPPPMGLASMAFHSGDFPEQQYVVLFGGLRDDNRDGTSEPSNDTWILSGTAWISLLPESAPPAERFGAAIASHDPSGDVVLFGGSGVSGFLGDTWSFSGGVGWTQQ